MQKRRLRRHQSPQRRITIPEPQSLRGESRRSKFASNAFLGVVAFAVVATAFVIVVGVDQESNEQNGADGLRRSREKQTGAEMVGSGLIEDEDAGGGRRNENEKASELLALPEIRRRRRRADSSRSPAHESLENLEERTLGRGYET